MLRKLDLFPSSSEGWETLTLSGPLEIANLNHWTFYAFPLLRTETGPVSEALCSLEYRTVDKVQIPSDPEYLFTEPVDDLTGALTICYISFRTINFCFLPQYILVPHVIERYTETGV
jgi:hypothetical protein